MLAKERGYNKREYFYSGICTQKYINIPAILDEEWSKMESKEPYFGSVRFFKNIIFLCCVLGIVIPTVLAVRWHSQAKTAESLLAQGAIVLTDGEEEAASAESEAASEEAEPEADSDDTEEAIGYQLLYPDFYAPTPLPEIEDTGKTMYLTFDDGPSDRTDEVLKILDEKNVKATFFVVGHEDELSIQRIKKAAAAGHTIGMHSYSHDYEKIYTSVEDFLDDFYKLFVILRDEAGVTPTVFRFPGGSLNNYNQGVYKEIIAEMLRRGFRYYDWNLSAEDATKKSPSAKTIVEGITSYSAQKKHGVVLMHDSTHCKTTVEALPELIDTLREQGFAFAPLDRTVRQVSFHYRTVSN